MDIDDKILTKLQLELKDIPNDDKLMKGLHNTFAQYMNPYVPMDEGILSNDIEILADSVWYKSPYAHYQYTGLVYGPNIPIIKNGVIVGWFSQPNKHLTGEPLNYSKEKHPLATHHWDEAMMRDKSEEFTNDLGKIIADNINKENGNE